MARYGIVIDVEKCTGCHSCFLACKDEFAGNEHLPTAAAQPMSGHKWLRINEIEHGTGTKVKVDYIPIMCQHCEDAPCMKQAPEDVVYRRKDGIIIIDPEKAKGCKELVNACPYGVIYWNEEKELPQKCTLCAHMLENGEKVTRCSESCPTGALVFGDLDDPNSQISKLVAAQSEKLETFKPEFNTKPLVKYINLPKPFIAGEVLLSDKLDECAKGVKVTLIANNDKRTITIETDFFGDFQFKGLTRDTEYTLRIENEGYYSKELTVKTNSSKNLGEIILEAK